MQSKMLAVIVFVLAATIAGVAVVAAQEPSPRGSRPRAPRANAGTAFTYQGQLKKNGAPVTNSCTLTFDLWDAASGGTHIAGPVTASPNPVGVANGLFTVLVDFGADGITGDARWAALGVQCPGDGSPTPLPRQPLTPAPMALALPGLYTQQNVTSTNLIGGYSGNWIMPGVVGATIGGGGQSGSFHHVFDDFGTIGGGISNTVGYDNGDPSLETNSTVGGGANNTASGKGSTIGGGQNNYANDVYATIGGGYNNNAGDLYATVGGGNFNTASFLYASVGGGDHNTANGMYSTVGGGGNNTATGNYSSVPGGQYNSAAMNTTLAAGYRAKANHTGAFVWADSSNADFASSANNQFLVRANGGVGINTNSPAANTLTVGGSGLKVGTPGTTLAVVQSGETTLGSGISGVNVFTITFPSAFPAPPHVLVTLQSENSNDAFALTTNSISATQFRVSVYRVDMPGNSWLQNLRLDWMAWLQP